MLKKIPERITYAQERIIRLIEERKLRKWCIENNLSHSLIYKIGTGELAPTYKVVSSMVHLISPEEWLFYTDEKLPYPPRLIPKWNPENKSKFVKEHDYREISKKYGISEISAYNIFVVSRSLPSMSLIRECCKETDPVNFFIEGDLSEKADVIEKFCPDRGDIINIQGSINLVLSKKEKIQKDGFITCVPVLPDCKDGIELKGTKIQGLIQTKCLKTYILAPKCTANYLESVSQDIINAVLIEARKVLD